MPLCWMMSLALAAVPAQVEWYYTGTLQRAEARNNETPSSKKFAVTVTVLKETGEDAVTFLTDDRDDGAWAWPERFGVLPLPMASTHMIRVRHKFDGNYYAVPLRNPIFNLPQEAEWTEGRDRYVRAGNKKIGERECTIIEATLDRGRRQTIAVETSTGLLVHLQERLFLGRGDAFELTLALEDSKTLDGPTLERTSGTTDALLKLQNQLQRTGETRPADLSREQVDATVAALPELKKTATGTMWARFVESLERDIAQQTRRLDGVAGLAQKFVGQPATLTDSRLITGGPLTAKELTGHTTVLHFWDYNGDKLVEPYGQVGYLDFLANRRTKLGAKVVGIAVDSRLGNAADANAALRSFRKLQEFMNLSYPIATDDGKLLAKFGDPRSLGNPLPLWVVIGHDGVITHYHAGNYDIQPDEGLKQLDAAVVAALKRELEAKRDKQ